MQSATIVLDSFLERSKKAATIFNKASWRCGRSNRRNMTMVKKKLSACEGIEHRAAGRTRDTRDEPRTALRGVDLSGSYHKLLRRLRWCSIL